MIEKIMEPDTWVIIFYMLTGAGFLFTIENFIRTDKQYSYREKAKGVRRERKEQKARALKWIKEDIVKESDCIEDGDIVFNVIGKKGIKGYVKIKSNWYRLKEQHIKWLSRLDLKEKDITKKWGESVDRS